MEQHGITVMTKSELLHGEDLEELKAMSWDQQALVDYEMMLKSSFFAGLQQSSFLTTLLSRATARSCLKALASGGQMKIWIRTSALGGMRERERESSSKGNENPHDLLSMLLGDRGAGYLFESTTWL